MRPNRPGEPDTGNPYVRFDEGRSGNAEPTTSVGSIRLFPLRLLYCVPVVLLIHSAHRFAI